MFGKLVTAATIVAAGVALWAGAAAAQVAAPQPVGMMGAAEAPHHEDDRGATPLVQAAGVVLVLGGGITIARGWVSPDDAG